MKYARIYQLVMDTPWALLPAKMETILEVLELRIAGERFSTEEIEARLGGRRPEPAAATSGAVAVLPLYGVMAQRMSLMAQSSGGTSTEAFARVFRQTVADTNVGAVILDIDSPGGDVFGTAELADTVHRARGRKPIVAVANSLAASAAYWVASQADELVVTPGGQVGSIGVFTAHRDVSARLEQDGERVTLISAGKYKTEGSPYEPLSEEARAAIQARVDTYYDLFTAAVARGRAVAQADVQRGFGQGRTVDAREAVRQGMADKVDTLENTIDRYAAQLQERSMGAPARSEALDLTSVSGATADWRRRKLRQLQHRFPPA